MTLRLLIIAFTILAAACGGAMTPPQDQVVSVFVTSGVPQPPAEDVTVQAGEPVVVHAEGLGPPRVLVFAPDNSAVAVSDVANGQRFTPSAPGKYRVELAGANGLVLVNVVAR